ncbi:MAG: LamG-like jellyroll fold domain-containing protein, partial [Planctomycetota bacterium]
MCRKLICLVSFILVLGLATTVAEAAIPDLLAWWTCDEGAGNVVGDASGNGHDGTFVNGAPSWVAGIHGSAVQLVGPTLVEVPALNVTLTEATMAGWIKPNGSQPDWSSIIMIRDPAPATGFNVLGFQLAYHWNDTAASYNYRGGDMIVDNDWTFAAVTIEPDKATFYVNGVAGSVNTITHGPCNWNSNIYLGGDGTDGFSGRRMDGALDDVSLFGRALTADEILVVMQGLGDYPYASGPDPEDGALLTEFSMGILGTTLTWREGDLADTHDVYFGDDFDAVNNGTGGTFNGNQADTYLLVGYGYLPNDPVPDGLEPGTTYYWRIDEVNDTEPNSPWKGNVWSFSLPPVTARDPKPADGAENVSADPVLSWTEGFGAIMYTPYFGESYEAVDNATGGTPGPGTSFTPTGPLEVGTTYYWRVDVGGAYGQIKGDIWSFTTVAGGTGRILREVWEGIGGNAVGDLTGNARYPDDPDISEYITSFDGPVDWADNYGTRIHGWLYVPTSGDYTFWVAGDNGSSLYLSTDIDPANKQVIAMVPGTEWTAHLEWTKFPEQQSDTITLVGGEKYYIEALHKEGGGGDSISASWRGPASPIQSVIAGEFLCLTPYDPIRAYAPNPGDGSTTAPPEPTLTWLPGKYAESHELYFGTDYDGVSNATTTSTEYIGPRALGNESYAPGKLDWGGTYYWRVDELSNTHPDSPWKGTTWNFTTTDYAIVDDFEDYNNDDKQIWAIWHDGLGYWDMQGTFHPGNGTGAAVGDEDNDATYMEETIVNSGNMSMPYFYNNNDPTKMKYSETKMTLINTRDWTEGGVKALSLWFQGYPASAGSFTDNLDGTYAMTVLGADITGPSDELHYAYKVLNGAGSIIARIDSVQNTDGWAKAGVMVRDTLDPNSAHAMVFVTPSNGVVFEYRPDTGADNVGSAAVQTGITAPHWVRLVRELPNLFTASHSSDGSTWEPLGVTEPINMNTPLYIGLALSGNNVDQICQAEFSNVQVSVSGPWSNQDIGIQSNDPERMYVAVANSNGTTGTVYYEDNDNIVEDATLIDTWTEFNIDLKDFQDQGVNLADVNSIAIGIGTRGTTTPGGAGKMYIDDTRLYRPRCVPDLIKPAGDFSNNCIVDYLDLEIMLNNWLMNDYDVTPVAPSDAGLVAHYKFENNLLDSSGNGNHGDP